MTVIRGSHAKMVNGKRSSQSRCVRPGAIVSEPAARIFDLASSILAASPLIEAERALLIALRFVELLNQIEHYRHEQRQADHIAD
jgi:hypothetical protein